MKKTLRIAFIFLGLSSISMAQVANFDAFVLDTTGVWNGADLTGDFVEEEFTFENYYDTTWAYWASGFAISNITDSVTEGYANMYGVISGEALSGENFAVATNYATIDVAAKVVDGFYVNNSSYAALSMLNGDDFSKQFGGETGNDPDWFKLSVIGKLDSLVTDTIEFYLADYRFEDNTQDYIVRDWTWVDLNALGNITELTFVLSSSDMGEWGMNTPAYFCMEDLTVNTIGLEELNSEILSVYPNPVQNQFAVNTSGELAIYDLSGKLVKSQMVEAGNVIYVNELTQGIYFVKVGSEVKKIVKL